MLIFKLTCLLGASWSDGAAELTYMFKVIDVATEADAPIAIDYDLEWCTVLR